MKITHKINSLFVVVTIFILASSIFLVNNAIGLDPIIDPSRNNSFVPSAITVDGNLSTGEWDEAAHIEEWYMDADAENTDGNNYMYLTEDATYLYIGLDICSDTTNDGTGEWVGVWLNTNRTQFFNESWENPTAWEGALNKGTESLIHNVEDDKTMEFFREDGVYFGYYVFSGDYYAVNGSADGIPNDGFYDDGIYYVVSSEYNGTHYITRIDYHIEFYDYFHIFEDMFVDHVFRVGLDAWSKHNVTVDDHFLSISDLEGNLNPQVRLSLGTGIIETAISLPVDSQYFTNRNKTILSIISVNSAPFNSSYDVLRPWIYCNETTSIGEGTAYPYSSIQDYEIAWSFGSSENNATDHRQFEIKIPKSELEGYESNTDLGIIVGGYGTLISFPNTHNWVYANGTDMYLPEESSIYYNYYSMPLKGQVVTTPSSTTSTSGTTSTTSSSTGGGAIDFSLYLIIGGVGAMGIVVVIILIMLRKK